ncbi:MAG: hypothetical protein Q8P56_03600, partial [Candidatus Uhrbacteria bacterium]|nr:hypothetical protein [Candidatus Uhrbacteria bacterium]
IALPFVVYFLVFSIHFGLLDKSGPGDAFMTPSFRKTLAGSPDALSPDIEPLGLFGKFTELNGQMYSANSRLSATHPYSSKWYTWPFMIRPIYYWNGSVAPENSGQVDMGQSRIYFLGNPIIWWASSVAIIFLLLVLLESLLRKFYKNEVNQTYSGLIPWLFAGAFMFNLLPFIGVSRVLFLYHYLSAYIFAILTLAYLSDRLSGKTKRITATCLILAGIASFLYFAPLSYGLPLDDAGYSARAWFTSWK